MTDRMKMNLCRLFSPLPLRPFRRAGLLLVWLTGTVNPLGAGERYALVIGNGTYAQSGTLPNASADASLMKTALTGAGFKVTLLTDLGLDGMRGALETFQTAASGAEAVVVYYAGHGMEKGGQNYFVPVDAIIKEEYQIASRTLPLSEVMGALDQTRVPLKILLLDCCRNNPLGRSFRRSGSTGLAALSDTPEGTIIAYATSPGKTALDGEGKNSPFAAALAGALGEKGLTVEEVIKRAIGGVKTATRREQVPWWSGNYEGHFVFRPGGGPPPPPPSVSGPAGATRERPWVNSLGMEFVPVPGTAVRFCTTETTKGQYRAYAAAVKGVDSEWESPDWNGKPVSFRDDHPVVNVSYEEAVKFCGWLSLKEGKTYRLPTDHEWSCAVGIGSQENAGATPKEKDGKVEGYPWGGSFEAGEIDGNYADGTAEAAGVISASEVIAGYRDGNATTAPVKSYRPNKLGIYDLGGNIWEWCGNWYDSEQKARVLRGGSWLYGGSLLCSSACRLSGHPGACYTYYGFRVVLVVPGSGG